MKRLVRGLPSSREGAWQGFALAMTEVRFPSTTPPRGHVGQPMDHVLLVEKPLQEAAADNMRGPMQNFGLFWLFFAYFGYFVTILSVFLV